MAFPSDESWGSKGDQIPGTASTWNILCVGSGVGQGVLSHVLF